ncbi:hypothetical protein VSO92_12675 [Myroides pelagicus]|uniref:hypothetical protein n=1 Tax=Myroides pelagicus TaxID=270914 RepID=UPI002DB6B8C9|nr:hypothetical protein [Myroides pelagicus]MEC4114957.1 hypothetical protein [Myroides pelagicus]
MRIFISPEMKEMALKESQRRDAYIKHHFEVNHFTGVERDSVGFCGEFAAVELLGGNWQTNIRENYHTIDDFDIILNGKKIDVKTETVPRKNALKIINKSIQDDELYGRRLINKNQLALLGKYDYVLFGLFIREEMDYWYPIGIIDTKTVLDKYPATIYRPDGNRYPFPGSPIPTSILSDYKILL